MKSIKYYIRTRLSQKVRNSIENIYVIEINVWFLVWDRVRDNVMNLLNDRTMREVKRRIFNATYVNKK